MTPSSSGEVSPCLLTHAAAVCGTETGDGLDGGVRVYQYGSAGSGDKVGNSDEHERHKPKAKKGQGRSETAA